MIRQRLGLEIYQGVLEVVLTALKAHGLFKRRHLGIDSSVIEANASLRTLVHRNMEQGSGNLRTTLGSPIFRRTGSLNVAGSKPATWR